jgi:hypothetical protein
MAEKLDLDETTLPIAQRMLSTPPNQHEAMKIGKSRGKSNKSPKEQRKKKT